MSNLSINTKTATMNFGKFIKTFDSLSSAPGLSIETHSMLSAVFAKALVDVVLTVELPAKFLRKLEQNPSCSDFVCGLYDSYSDILRKNNIQFRDASEYDDMAFPVNRKLLKEAFTNAFGKKLSKIGLQNITNAFELDTNSVNTLANVLND